MKVYFVNDTSAFHCGSWAVSESIKREILAKGYELSIEANKTIIEEDAIRACDLVLVNGEGTLHDNSQRSIRVLSMLRQAQSLGKKTAICNASWWNMTSEFDDVLRKLDYFAVRESISANLLQKAHGVSPDLHLDVSYWSDTAATTREKTRKIACTDFYSPEFKCFVRVTGGSLFKFHFMDMAAMDWQAMLNETAATECLATGRHHGVYAACKAGTPFIALPGNTPKIEGLIAWSGIDIPIAKHPSEIQGLLSTYRRHRAAFSELFDWMRSQPVWHLPF